MQDQLIYPEELILFEIYKHLDCIKLFNLYKSCKDFYQKLQCRKHEILLKRYQANIKTFNPSFLSVLTGKDPSLQTYYLVKNISKKNPGLSHIQCLGCNQIVNKNKLEVSPHKNHSQGCTICEWCQLPQTLHKNWWCKFSSHRCAYCNLTFYNHELESHHLICFEKKTSCHYCKKIYKVNNPIEVSEHNESCVKYCKFCKQKTPWKDLKKHGYYCNKRYMDCRTCGAPFFPNNSKSLEKHNSTCISKYYLKDPKNFY